MCSIVGGAVQISSLTVGEVQDEGAVTHTHTHTLTVHGHLIDLCAVVLLNITQNTNIIILYKVDGHPSSPIATRASNPV